jgi:hypothetical protein
VHKYDPAANRARRLETQLARFEDAAWSDADLVNASFALPLVASLSGSGLATDALRSRIEMKGPVP